MQKIKKAFSLLEVIIATWILTITVFWIYKIIWENSKIVANSNNYLNQNILFENVKECLKWENFSEKKFLDFWNDFKKCNFSTTEKFFQIDWIDYLISIETVDKNWKVIINSSTVWEKIFETKK